MAEFCLECWNKINKTEDKSDKYIMSKELELCEGCGEWKRVVIVKKCYSYSKLGLIFSLFEFMRWLVLMIFRHKKDK